MAKSLFAGGLVVAVALTGCVGSTDAPAADSGPVQEVDVDSTKDSASRERDFPVTDPASDPSTRDAGSLTTESPLDRLLPDEVINGYISSFETDNSIVSSEGQSTFPELESVRPKECGEVLKFATTALANPVGELAGAASNYVSLKPPGGLSGPIFSQKTWTYPSEIDALAAFTSAKAVLSDCTDASAEWPQTGSFRIDDGMNQVSLEVGKVRKETDSLVSMQGKRDYSGEITDYWSIALVKDSIVWMKSVFYGDVANNRRGEIFDTFVQDSVDYATLGDRSAISEPTDPAAVTLDCLSLTPLPFKLVENYSQVSGPGAGDDLFVETRVRATNTCGKAIKGFQYDETFTDAFGDVLLEGSGTFKKEIEPGATRKTEANRGYVISSAFGEEDIEALVSTSPRDIALEAVVTQILFVDGTSLP